MHLEKINLELCPFDWHGENIAYFSRGRLRTVAKHLSLRADEAKPEMLKRIVFHLMENGVAEIDGVTQVTIPR